MVNHESKREPVRQVANGGTVPDHLPQAEVRGPAARAAEFFRTPSDLEIPTFIRRQMD
jgi:hypothetical protein